MLVPLSIPTATSERFSIPVTAAFVKQFRRIARSRRTPKLCRRTGLPAFSKGCVPKRVALPGPWRLVPSEILRLRHDLPRGWRGWSGRMARMTYPILECVWRPPLGRCP